MAREKGFNKLVPDSLVAVVRETYRRMRDQGMKEGAAIVAINSAVRATLRLELDHGLTYYTREERQQRQGALADQE